MSDRGALSKLHQWRRKIGAIPTMRLTGGLGIAAGAVAAIGTVVINNMPIGNGRTIAILLLADVLFATMGCIGVIFIYRREYYDVIRVAGLPAIVTGALLVVVGAMVCGLATYRLVMLLFSP